MTLLAFDGFDAYATAQFAVRGWAAGYTTYAIESSGGRNGSGAGYNSGTSGSKQMTIAASGTVTVGFAKKMDALNAPLIILADTTYATMQVLLQLNSIGLVEVRSGTGWPGGTGTVRATGTQVIAAGAWYYYEVQAVIGDSGSVIVHINGVEDINATGIDIQAGSNAYVDRIVLTGGGYTDDFYVEDGDDATATQGHPYNDFLGDVRCEVHAADRQRQLVGLRGVGLRLDGQLPARR